MPSLHSAPGMCYMNDTLHTRAFTNPGFGVYVEIPFSRSDRPF